jgi:hypothetical protein
LIKIGTVLVTTLTEKKDTIHTIWHKNGYIIQFWQIYLLLLLWKWSVHLWSLSVTIPLISFSVRCQQCNGSFGYSWKLRWNHSMESPN